MKTTLPLFRLLTPSVLGIALSLAATNPTSAATVYAATSGNWTDNIWANDIPAAPGSSAAPVAGDTVQWGTFSSNIAVTVNSVITPQFNIIQLNRTGASLAVNTGGSLTMTSNLNIGQATGITASVTIGGGALTVGGALGIAASAGSTGTLTVNSGTLAVVGTLTNASNATGTGTFNLNGGTVTVNAFNSGSGTANFNWAGGTFTFASTNRNINNSGTGILAPGGVGTVGTMTYSTGVNSTLSYSQGASAASTFDFASDLSFDKIVRTGTGVDTGTLSLTLAGTVNLNLLGGYTPTVGMTFDIMTATTITDSGFVLGGNGAGLFTYEIIDGPTSDILRLTAVPEPGVWALLGIGALIFLRPRRKTA